MILTILQTDGGSILTFLPLIGVFVIMYFFFIRPQIKKQKQEKSFQANLKNGTRVVTTSGIHGKIANVSDATIVLETSAGKITFEKAAISREFTVARFPETEVKK